MLHIYDASDSEAEAEAGGGRDLFFGSVMITHSSPRRETVRGRGKERTFNYGNKPADHGAGTASHLVDHLVHGQ